MARYKIILCGPSKCGKTTIFRLLASLQPSEKYIPTSNIEVAIIDYNFNGKILQIDLWDIPGRISSANLKQCMKDADLIIRLGSSVRPTYQYSTIGHHRTFIFGSDIKEVKNKINIFLSKITKV